MLSRGSRAPADAHLGCHIESLGARASRHHSAGVPVPSCIFLADWGCNSWKLSGRCMSNNPVCGSYSKPSKGAKPKVNSSCRAGNLLLKRSRFHTDEAQSPCRRKRTCSACCLFLLMTIFKLAQQVPDSPIPAQAPAGNWQAGLRSKERPRAKPKADDFRQMLARKYPRSLVFILLAKLRVAALGCIIG